MSTEETDSRREYPLLGLLLVVLKYWKSIAWTAIAFGVGALLFALLRPSRFVATASFSPNKLETQPIGQVAGLVAQLGVELSGNYSDAPRFYVALTRSRGLLLRVASDTFGTVEDNVKADLATALGIEGMSPGERKRAAVEELRGMLHAGVDAQAGLVDVRVVARAPGLAEEVARSVLDNINAFNIEQKRAQAARERLFVQSRVADAEASLDSAERDLAHFHATNRVYQNSPELSLEQERRAWRVQHRRALLTSLVQSLERATIEEMRNTPSIVTVDAPEGGATPLPRNWAFHLLLGLTFGGFVGLAAAWMRESTVRARQDAPEDFAAIAELKNAAGDEIRRLTHRFRS